MLYLDPNNSRYDLLRTIDNWTFISTRRAEKEIEEEFVKYSPDKSFHEWGARIYRAMQLVIE